MNDARSPESSNDSRALLESLTPTQRATFAQLVAQHGQGCGIPRQSRQPLSAKGLITPEIDAATGDNVVCGCGQNHHCYVIAPEVLRVYGEWSAAAQPQEAEAPAAQEPDAIADDLRDIFAQLSDQEASTLERLFAQDGMACTLNRECVLSLVEYDLLMAVTDVLTNDLRVCAHGCGHVWYDIPEPVRVAYATWSAQWEEAEDAQPQPGATPPPLLPVPPEPRPLAVRQAPRQHHWCRFTLPGLGYFTYKGTNYDRGQLLHLSGGPRDEQLERLGYVYPAPKDETYLQAQCGVCQAWFLTESFRDQHGRLRHRGRFEEDLEIGGGMAGPQGGAALRDTTGDADERRMQAQYPLHLDKTRATLEG